MPSVVRRRFGAVLSSALIGALVFTPARALTTGTVDTGRIVAMAAQGVPTEVTIGAEAVRNPVAEIDRGGWQAASAAGAVDVRRIIGVGGGPATSTGFAFDRPGGSGEWALATAALTDPATFFKVGHTYRMQAWVRNSGGTAQEVGLSLANDHFEHRPTEVSEHVELTGQSWRLVRRTFVATARGAADTALYLTLPNAGAVHVEVTGASVREVAAPEPRETTRAPEVITFGGEKGAAPDPAVWSYETGGHGWGNDEIQTYLAGAGNAQLDGDGKLRVIARRETARGTDGTTRDYTSARLSTRGKLEIPSGSYVEASITAPTGPGAWPAFWLLGTNFGERGWPDAGELDVFEGWGSDPDIAHAAMHLGGVEDPASDLPYGWGEPGGSTRLPEALDAKPHTYGVYFDDNVVRFFIDRKPTLTIWALDARMSGRRWPFGESFYAVLNVAVTKEAGRSGGDWPKTMTVSPISIWTGGVPAGPAG